MYSKEVLKYFQKPHNQGKIKKPSAVGHVGNPFCGDTMTIYLRVKSQRSKVKSKKSHSENFNSQDIIEEIKFETLGCAAAIASSSVLTDLVKGRTIEKALQVTKDDVLKKLGEMPEQKIHCSLLAVDALKKAVEELKK